ncbi:hypothetical protein [uncultured Rikenella sp.]|uniref:hypothetical protein n=1 Tax=uncultured Rikenella sp. TaxID=368003 RepID=UPI0026376DA9|nr:hypothetical protein [uncultured Rikenella sp.]
MAYRYYNANAVGNIAMDCTIRAISCATGKSWDYVYEHLSDLAQERGTMMDNSEFIINYLDRRYEKIPVYGETVGELSEMYPNNILLITMEGHITCSKYGTIYDIWDCRRRQAEYAWLIN